jgi:hypothetical protein
LVVNNIAENDADVFAPMLLNCKLTRLGSLSLRHNRFTLTILTVAPALAGLTNLSQLNLAGGANVLGADFTPLASALTSLTALTNLNLSYNYFGPDSCSVSLIVKTDTASNPGP